METKRTYGLFLCCCFVVVVRSKSLPEIESDGSEKNGTEGIVVQLKEYSFDEQPKIERIIEKNNLTYHENGEVPLTSLKEVGPALDSWKKLKFNKDMKPPPSVDFYGSIEGHMFVENKLNNVKSPSHSQFPRNINTLIVTEKLDSRVSSSSDNHLSMPQLAADMAYVKKAEGHRRNVIRKNNVQSTIMESIVPVSKATASETEHDTRRQTKSTLVLMTTESSTTEAVTVSPSMTTTNQNQEPELRKQQETKQSFEPGIKDVKLSQIGV